MASPRTFLSLCAPRGLWLLGMAVLLSSAPVHAQSTGPVLSMFGPGGRITVPPATPKLPRPRALAQPTADSISVAYQKGQAPIAPDAITPLGTDLFGDKINLFNGSFSFEHTDVELPGNHALPVALVRRHLPGRQPLVRGAMGDWDVQTPRIEGSFSVAAGWVPAYGSPANRCSGFNMPPDVSVQTVDGAFDFAPYEYWHGTHLAIPGQGNQEILARAAANPQAPTDGNVYPLVTAQNWQIGCLASVQNAPGQGFFAVSPQGVRYRFDWMASRAISSIRKGTYLLRRDFYLMATEVSDRFGNWVRYSYDPANPLHLTRIESNDGRVITLGYTGGRVSSVWDGTRTWLYSYAATSDLQSVQLPDGSRWQFNLRPLMDVNPSINEAFPDCDSDPAVGNLGGVGSITHPSGAVGTFAATMLMHGRTNVTRVCTYDLLSGWTNGNVWPRVTINLGLVSKQISGPGMATMTWLYASGGPGQGEWAPCSTCMDRRVITVTEPSGAITRHSFGILWRVNEGQLLRVEEGWNGTSALRTTDYSYQSASGQLFPDGFGDSVDFMTDFVSTRNRPMRTKQIAQQGVGFNWTANSFDFRARPVTVTKAGPGGSRIETTAYQDFTTPWILGQVASVSSGSTLPVENSYDGLGQLRIHKQFGLVQSTQTYWPDGTLRTRADGKGNTTSFSNYHRGIPRNIAFPLSVSVSGVVNNIGHLTSITDPLGQVTSYGYDAMGRLASITPPGGFNETFISYFRLAAASDGLPAGTWGRTIATGSARVRTYYDELWRVVMTSTLDDEWPEATRVDIKRYDAGGRLAFESYAQGRDTTAATSSPGKRYQYDALNRRKREAADSELGELVTLTEYLNGFETRITNPRGHVSTHSYWALDNPAEALLRGVKYASGTGLPQEVSVSIKRDAFGKPLNISRSGSGLLGGVYSSSSRSYVYDAHQRLCKTLEPELIATVQQWDAVGNLEWTAPGVDLPSAVCDATSVPASAKISHSYDALNRLTGTSYGDGSHGITRTYFADGKLQTVNSGGANWTYAYNALRKLTTESLNYNGQTFSFTRGYNLNGHVNSLRYPSGLTLEYTLNGLGQPLEVGTVAGGPGPSFHYLRFHPNGGLKEIDDDRVVITQNLRGLPHKWKVDTRLEDEYRYDANGNVTGISDLVSGLTNRSMQYDALDRLTSANAPGLWGAATYTYDALDNLRTAHVGSRSVTLGYDTRNRLSSLSGSQSLNYTYDARGNVSSRGNTSFHFDLGNRLLSSGGNSYAYDGHGRRVRIISSDGSTRYQVYGADGQLLWSTNAGGGRPASHTAYVYVAGRLAAEVDSVKGVHYVYTDALGSPVARQSAADWAQRSRTHYEPYGGIAGGTAPSAATSQVGFTGHVQDLETGLVYMQQRYYEPIAGRFLSVDPVVTDAQTGGFFGRYHYANNNPYRFTDPTGMAPSDCTGTRIAGGCAAGGGVANSHSSHGGAAAASTVANFFDGGHGQKFAEAVNAGERGRAAAHFVAGMAHTAMATMAVPIRGVGLLVAKGTLAANQAAGKVAEARAAVDLVAEGNKILGSQVSVRTSEGRRVVDHLIQTPSGQIVACEVKCGGAVRNASQLAKDGAMATEGGVVIGKNAPDALRGQQIVIPTIERRY